MRQLSSSIQSLQASADAGFIRKHVRRQANAQILAAIVLLGQAFLEYPHRGSLAAIAGAALLGIEAIWLLRVRRPVPLLSAALLLWAVAIWNAYIAFAGYTSGWVWAGLYVFLGSREYSRYRKFRCALLAESEESRAELAAVAESMLNPDEDMIRPHVDGDPWTGRLFTNAIALCDDKGHIVFLPRD